MKSIAKLAAYAVLVPSLVSGQVIFNFVYEDVENNSGIGFDDSASGAERRQALQDVGNYIGGLLDHNATITYTIKASQTDGNGSLASAGSSYGLLQGTNTVRGSNMALAIQGLSSNTTRGYMTVDFGFAWNFSEAAASDFEYDFRSVALHEMTHSLGMTSLIDEVTGEGSNVVSGGNYYGQTYSTYDSFLVDGEGNPLIMDSAEFDTARFTDGADSDDVLDIFTSENLFFNGPNAVAVYGAPVPLFSPGTYLGGSSTSHVDSDDPTLDEDPMVHHIGFGESKREYTALDLAIIEDLGYSLVAVPEPASSGLLTLGLAVFFCGRRRD
ncbi:PEP-CTERM sorting domain-containing protein [Verrucomicrobiaceae bacterium R5-34]|nr:PEP-CTERM sorting domain-containing protein [Verrucomicrobiaceae bacterium R5-34]